MSTLIIDFGNSRLKWRSLDARQPRAEGVLAHASRDPQAGGGLMQLLRQQWQHLAPPHRLLYASVSSEAATAELEHCLTALFPSTTQQRIRSSTSLGGIENGYRDPAQLGVDRLLAMIGARAQISHGALLVIGIGTATTVDLVNAEHRFVGGVILPGPELMAQALKSGTAALPQIRLQAGISADFAIETVAAIGAGVINAQAGAIERLRQRALMQCAELECMVGGGGAKALLPYLSFPARCADNLVLDGLARLAIA